MISKFVESNNLPALRFIASTMNCPSMGDSIEDGTLEEWKVRIGERVEAGDVIASIETDKITVDIAAEFDGIITKIHVPSEETATVGEPLCEIDPDAKEGEGSAVEGKKQEKTVEDPSGLDRLIVLKPMSRMRQTVASRLKESQNNAASLTTFNEVDMTNLMACRKKHGAAFSEVNGIKLGINGFFLKASQMALKKFPDVNNYIDETGKNILSPEFIDISVAVATPTGLMTPCIRSAENHTIADFESDLAEVANKGRSGDISMEDMVGGTFTISNGGVFGSLMGTPIINPPQSGILGMHGTFMRPKVMEDGSIQARPMMYIALTYDHRIVDGREAVLFLKDIKESIEDPSKLNFDQCLTR